MSSLAAPAARTDAERFVFALYRAVLGREPDPVGFESHVRVLLNGGTYATVAEAFATCEEVKARTRPKLYAPPGHFLSPIVDPAEAQAHFAALARAPVPRSLPGITIDDKAMLAEWTRMVPLFQSIPFERSPRPPFRYGFDNQSYVWADGSVLHAMIRLRRPKRLVEIGSGWSSACALDTVEHFLENKCELTFIEPYPALLNSVIGETKRVRIIRKPVQQIPLTLFGELRANDILFIDSTHVLRTGSDVCFELFEILPRLSPGVIVHFHDIFWPFEYPTLWALDENRSWNELYAVRAFLYRNPEWRIIFFNSYFAQMHASEIKATYPSFMLNTGGALWLEKH